LTDPYRKGKFFSDAKEFFEKNSWRLTKEYLSVLPPKEGEITDKLLE
jgi:hypothetical protein